MRSQKRTDKARWRGIETHYKEEIMSFEYTYPKKKFDKKDIIFMYLFFDNGDYISLNGSEVVDIKINLYDRLISGERGLCPVAESGYIKLNVDKKNKAIYEGFFLYNAKEYKKDRKEYIEHRCVYEGGVKSVRLFDENNWHDTIYGNIACETDGEFLTLKFLSQPNFGSADSENNVVLLNPIGKSIIESINLDFENCEDYTIYKNEILDIQIEFEKELVWGSDDLFRSIKSGFIKLEFDKDIDYRRIHFLDDGKVTVKRLERRLCGKSGQADHDICHLYIDYGYAGYSSHRTECIEIKDIRPDEELDRLDKLEEESGHDMFYFVGGHCKKQDDGTIIITFGKNAENALKKLS